MSRATAAPDPLPNDTLAVLAGLLKKSGGSLIRRGVWTDSVNGSIGVVRDAETLDVTGARSSRGVGANAGSMLEEKGGQITGERDMVVMWMECERPSDWGVAWCWRGV